MSDRIESLWAAVGAAPDDLLLRDALSDACRDEGHPFLDHMADAVTATRVFIPEQCLAYGGPVFALFEPRITDEPKPSYVYDLSLCGKLTGHRVPFHRRSAIGFDSHGHAWTYPTALAALRDLANAWVKAYRFEDKLS